MKVFDASSIIYAWDNYPFEQFPPLWDWLGEQIDAGEIVVPRVALTEVAQISPDCHDWLTGRQLQVIEVSNDIANEASRIKALIGVVNDNYHAKGVGENDILIIATTMDLEADLVSDEGRQNKVPQEPRKRRIPSVCDIQSVDVNCVNFIDYLKGSGQVFR